jgi:hypothetical protein
LEVHGCLFSTVSLTTNVCLVSLSTAARLSGAEAPKEMAVFLQRQRSIFQQERQRRKEATDLIHGFTEEDGIPPSIPRDEENDIEKIRMKDAFAFMSRYRAAKEAILRSTEAFWKNDAKKEEEEDSSDSLSPLECVKRWDSSNRELDDLITEMELSLSSSSEDGDEIPSPFLQGGKETWTVVWLSLMTICSTNVVGLVLSLALLNYNLRPGTSGYEDLINMLGDGNFFSMCRELLEAAQETSSDQDIPYLSSEDSQEEPGAIVLTSKPRYLGVQEKIYERLKDNLDQWMFDSATTFRQALTSIRSGANSDPRILLPALASPMQALVSPTQAVLGIAESNEVDEEMETNGEDAEDEYTVSDTESTSTWSPNFDSNTIVDVPALVRKAQNSVHQLLLDAVTYDDDEDEMDLGEMDLGFEVPDVDEYNRGTSSPIEFTRVEAFHIAKLVTKVKEEESTEALEIEVEIEEDVVMATHSLSPGSPTVQPFEIISQDPATVQSNSSPVTSSVGKPTPTPTGKPQKPTNPNDKSEDREEKENCTGFSSENDDQIIQMASSEETSSTIHESVSSEEEIEYIGDVCDVPSDESEARRHRVASKCDKAPGEHSKDQRAELDATPQPMVMETPIMAPPTTETEDDQSTVAVDTAPQSMKKIEGNVTPLSSTTVTEDDDSDIIANSVPEESNDTTSESMNMMDMTTASEGYHDTIASIVPDESEREDQTLEHDVSPKTIELPAAKSRRWDAIFTLGAMTVIGFGASIALGAKSKR